MNIPGEDAITAASVARRVGVGRAAVANWRKRYPDFPQPVAGGPNSPLFSWLAVRQWLVDSGKAEQLEAEGRTATGTQRLAAAPPADDMPDRGVTALPPAELLARVLVALLPRIDAGSDDEELPIVLDPTCSGGPVLAAAAERYGDRVRLAGQAPDNTTAESVRQSLPEADIRVGDALVADRFPELRAGVRGVVCVPPSGARGWPASELADDPRWRFGLPDAAEPELAWVQHCLSLLRHRGVAVVVMSPVSGVRAAGRHVRAALVRAGVLRDVIALPERLTPTGEGAVHVWLLQRGGATRAVRMADLTGVVDVAEVPQDWATWEALLEDGNPSLVREVPAVELLDGEVPLVPSRHLRAADAGSAVDLSWTVDRLAVLYTGLAQALPRPVAPRTRPAHPQVTVAELERSRAVALLPRDATPRAGDVLFRTMGRPPIVATGTAHDEQGVAQVLHVDPARLDPHFVALFVRPDALAAPVANTHAALTRDDVRRCRLPKMPLAEQRRYGEAIRRLHDLEAVADRLATLTGAVVAQATHGLTTGAISPTLTTARESIDPESDEHEKRTT